MPLMSSDPLGEPFDGGEYAPHREYPEVVLCFDRDYTISNSPPPANHGKAVPLAWVRYLAHDENAPNIDIWATGNQRLRHEAMIPGFNEALACWEQLTHQPAFDRFERVFGDERKPRRRDGLRLIANLYHDSPHIGSVVPKQTSPATLAVVDDVNLADLSADGFKYFHPDIFTTLVETTDGYPELFAGTDISLPLDSLPTGYTRGDDEPTAEFAYTDAALTSSSVSYRSDTPDQHTWAATHFDPTLI